MPTRRRSGYRQDRERRWSGRLLLIRDGTRRTPVGPQHWTGGAWRRGQRHELADRWVVIRTDWAGYRAMLKIRGEGPSPRIIYLDGRMTLVSPGYSHELIKKRLATLIEEVIIGLDIPAVVAGATTLRDKPRRGGAEGDEAYYFANSEKVAGNKAIDLRVDLPPDLAVEAVVSHPVKDALEVYRRLGVPEVWVCDGRCFGSWPSRPIRPMPSAPTSKSLPMLSAVDLLRWVQHLPDARHNTWGREVGITNTGAISGATSITANGTITFSGLPAAAGVVTNNSSGVLSSVSGANNQLLAINGAGTIGFSNAIPTGY